MSQDSEDLAGGGNNGGKTVVSGQTGTVCTRTGLYKATDGKTAVIEVYEQGQLYLAYPGGNGKTKCTWTSLSVAEGDSNSGFRSVLVPAGTA